MAILSATVFAVLPSALIDYAASTLGAPREELHATAGLTAADLEDPDGLVPYETLLALWSFLTARYPDQPLGLNYGRRADMRLFGALGQACTNAPTLAEAYAIYQRWSELVDPYAKLDVWHDSTRTLVSFDHEPRALAMPEVMEMLMTSLCTTNRLISEQLAHPRRVSLRHARRHPLAAYTEAFASDVAFETDAYSIEYPSVDFMAAPRGANPTAGRYLERYLAKLNRELRAHSAQTPSDAWLSRLRGEIEQCLASGDARELTIAKRLGMSSRSLQRALHERGTSFADLLTQVRQERSLALLERRELSAAEIAFLLGYADARSFYRWFRNWQGVSPGAYRKSRHGK